jgi:hypothetical protein
MSAWLKTIGTQTGRFILGLTGVSLKNNAGDLQVRNNADSAFAGATVEDIAIHNNTAGFSNTIRTQSTQAANYVYDLPLDAGSVGQVLSTDGSGLLSWVSAASTDANWKVETTTINFGSGATTAAFTLPVNAIIDKVMVLVDTAFDGTPTLSVGDSGNNSRFMGSGDNLLTLADRFDVFNQVAAVGSTTAVEIYYSAGGATVGSARVLCTYAVPA